jgi:hypothetical protein
MDPSLRWQMAAEMAFAVFKSGLAHSGDFYHKMRKTGRHCASATPTKQSIAISVLCASGLLPAAFLAVAMTMNL